MYTVQVVSLLYIYLSTIFIDDLRIPDLSEVQKHENVPSCSYKNNNDFTDVI